MCHSGHLSDQVQLALLHQVQQESAQVGAYLLA
jgi:hypothetical protein